MEAFESNEMDAQSTKGNSGLSWAVEIEFSDKLQKSVFRSVRKVILDGECVQLQLLDGSYEAFPIEHVRKTLSMRAIIPTDYTGDDLRADELY